jgi:hypothetical protein
MWQIDDFNFSVVCQYKIDEQTSTSDHAFGSTAILTDLPDIKDQQLHLTAAFSNIMWCVQKVSNLHLSHINQ